MRELERCIEELIEATYSNEDGVDERTHIAILDLVYTYHLAMSGREEDAEHAIKEINAKVDATDGRFYF
jgi:hypothetical protein